MMSESSRFHCVPMISKLMILGRSRGTQPNCDLGTQSDAVAGRSQNASLAAHTQFSSLTASDCVRVIMGRDRLTASPRVRARRPPDAVRR